MNWIPFLLTDPSPCLRYLVLKELLNRPDNDSEIVELRELYEEDPLVKDLLNSQNSDGSWDMQTITQITSGNRFYATVYALNRLGYLMFDSTLPIIQKAVEYVFSKQGKDGSWPMPGKTQLTDEDKGYSMMPVQTAIPLLALSTAGYATDERSENAYSWLLEQKLDDGAWPVGISSGVYGGIAGYRRLAHSRWGCRSNTTTVLNCLAMHPKRCKSVEAHRALDLLLGTNTKLRNNLGFVVARLIGVEKSYGNITYFAKFDIAHILDLCWRVGANPSDVRIDDFIEFIKSEQGKYGIWEYSGHPQANRWLTFDLLRSLSRLDKNADWVNFEPQTPFQAYPKKIKRF